MKTKELVGEYLKSDEKQKSVGMGKKLLLDSRRLSDFFSFLSLLSTTHCCPFFFSNQGKSKQHPLPSDHMKEKKF
jgi:hypothetical protein